MSIKTKGAMLEEVPKEGERLKIFGSAMMAHAASKDEVLEVIKKDIYFKNNVWNLDKVFLPKPISWELCWHVPQIQIYPVSFGHNQDLDTFSWRILQFKTAFRNP